MITVRSRGNPKCSVASAVMQDNAGAAGTSGVSMYPSAIAHAGALNFKREMNKLTAAQACRRAPPGDLHGFLAPTRVVVRANTGASRPIP